MAIQGRKQRLQAKNNYMHGKYKAFLFDFDFTLCDSSQGQCECVNYALIKMGYGKANDADILRTVGLSFEDIFEILAGVTESEKKHLFRLLFTERADEIMAASVTMFPGVDILLSELQRRKIKVGIVSTKYRYRIEEILSNHSLGSYVDVIIGGEDVENYKPHPEGVFLALDKLGISAEDALYIGDSIVDAETAASSGLDFAAMLSGTTTISEFNRYAPLAIMQGVHELLTIPEFSNTL